MLAERSACTLRKQEGEMEETVIKSFESLPENGQWGSTKGLGRIVKSKVKAIVINEAINSIIALCRVARELI